MIYFAFLVVAFVATLAVLKLKERSLYVLFLAAYTQNFIAPFLYTRGYIGKDWARGLVLLKDFLLLELFAWSVVLLFKQFRRPWPRPLKPLAILTAYCTFRFIVGVVFLNDDWGQGITRVRNIWFPLEILVVVMVLTALHPEFGRKFLRDITYILSALAVVALGILLWAPRDFWVDNANIAEFQVEVKGDTENEMNFEEGLSLAGTMQGRETLMFLSSFRALGTFGEALALSLSMAVPVLLLSFYFPKSMISMLSLVAASAALFFSLTRSAWIFCGFVAIYVLLRRHQYRPFLVAGGALLAFFLLWPPMAEFAALTVSHLSPSADNPDSLHAEGVLWFYTRGFSDSRNILGKGMSGEVRDIPESGYAYLLEHFGAVAYVSFLWFCVSLYRQLRVVRRRNAALSTVAQAIPLGILIIMHFSQYPFSLPAFLSLWYVVGLCLSDYLHPRTDLGLKPASVDGLAPQIQPA
jgi:hypothetical protein